MSFHIDKDLAAKPAHGVKLGDVKDFSTLIQLAQIEGVPLSETIAGAPDQKEQAAQAFEKIAGSIISKTLRE